MSEALEILIISVELFIFYLRAICDRILRREFGHAVLHPVVSPHWLESPSRWDAVTRFQAVSLVLLVVHLILRLVRS
jgi:hypothetical protein